MWSWPNRSRVVLIGCVVAMSAAPAMTAEQPADSVPAADDSSAPSKVASIAGRWYSAFGFLDFVQDGHNFKGTYSCCQGTMQGTVVENQIDFIWQDPIYGTGWGTFTLRDGGAKLVGVWGKDEDFGSRGTWNGARLEEPEIAGEIRRYAVEVKHPTFGEFDGFAVLGIDGESVTGQLVGFFATPAKDGHFYRDEIVFPLVGRLAAGRLALEWEDPRNEELGGLELAPDGDGWTGEWEAHRTDRRVPIRWQPAKTSEATASDPAE